MEHVVELVRFLFLGILLIGGGYVAYVLGRLAWDKGRTPKSKDQA
jgi:hypothetical protein